MTSATKIIVCFGTRPEAIKMAPVIRALERSPLFDTRVVVTAQHRTMLDQALSFMDITPDWDLDLMQPGQSLDALGARILSSFGEVLDAERPDRVLVHGDTTTTLFASLCSYFRKIPVGHVEAGLRSGDNLAPWPEEVNRKVADNIADLHFAPTQGAVNALVSEGIGPASIHLTGNTVIDALLDTRARIAADPGLAPLIASLRRDARGKRIILATAHRRESFGSGLKSIANAIIELAQRGDAIVVVPLHPNPQVQSDARALLEGRENVLLLPPLDYPEFVALMDWSDLILTDSGGVQEEAPSLAKPVLVMREVTERPEGIAAGNARLVGTHTRSIVYEANRLLDNHTAYSDMARAHNPYGDGKSADRIVSILEKEHGQQRMCSSAFLSEELGVVEGANPNQAA